MPISPPAPWGARPAANDNRERLPHRARRRLLPLLTAVFLISGAALHLVNIHVDSVVISHTSRSAMIFGLVGLRRGMQPGSDTARDEQGPAA